MKNAISIILDRVLSKPVGFFFFTLVFGAITVVGIAYFQGGLSNFVRSVVSTLEGFQDWSAISVAITLSIVVCGLLLLYVTLHALTNQKWDQLRGMAGEFVAVFAAFGLATWLSVAERQVEREEARQERREERREEANALLLAAEGFASSLSRLYAENAISAMSAGPLPSPSIFDIVISSGPVNVFHPEVSGILMQKVGEIQILLSQSPANFCELTEREQNWIGSMRVIPREMPLPNLSGRQGEVSVKRVRCLRERLLDIEKTLNEIASIACTGYKKDEVETLPDTLLFGFTPLFFNDGKLFLSPSACANIGVDTAMIAALDRLMIQLIDER